MYGTPGGQPVLAWSGTVWKPSSSTGGMGAPGGTVTAVAAAGRSVMPGGSPGRSVILSGALISLLLAAQPHAPGPLGRHHLPPLRPRELALPGHRLLHTDRPG